MEASNVLNAIPMTASSPGAGIIAVGIGGVSMTRMAQKI
jgi:hypothetical protein